LIGPGVLYGSINRMLELRWIEESDDRPDPHLDDERRRYYRITSLGRKVARAEAVRMKDLVKLAAATFGAPRNA
jgi:DNA-binding PadR family transcriptional regulator